MIHKDSDTDRNRTVGNIERRPVVFTDIKIEEISDHTEPDPVDEVTDSSAENQRKTDRQPDMCLGRL